MLNGGCGVVVLAAGAARRFGSPKLLMPFGGSTVIGSVVGSLSRARVSPIVVVTGADPEATKESLSGQPVHILANPNWTVGMVSSVRVGVEELPDSLDRFLVALGDQPRIHPDGVVQLLRELVESRKGIAIPTYRGRRGHPVAFDIRYRREILALTDQQTLRDVISAWPDDILEVELASEAYVSDIDTREEYEHELARWRAEG